MVDDLRTAAMDMHHEMGILEANGNWIRCRDINGISGSLKNNILKISTLAKSIRHTMLNIDLILPDADMEIFKTQCDEKQLSSRLSTEIAIEREHRPSNAIYDKETNRITYGPMNYNKKALINMTQCIIPEDICIGLSFGWKFLFPYVTNDENIHEAIAQLDNCIEDTIHESMQWETFIEMTREVGNRKKFEEDITLQWLTFINKRTKDFLDRNEELFPTRADKGACTVLILKEDYDLAIENMLVGENYSKIDDDPLHELISMERKLIKIIRTNHKCMKHTNISTDIRRYQPKILKLASFYGLPKIHKPGFKLRPITSMRGAPGHLLGRIFNFMLKKVFHVTEYHVKDSYSLKAFLDSTVIPESDILISFDVIDMFSNIPTDLARDIIMNKFMDFYKEYGIGRKILISILDFLLDKCTIFTALGYTYKQKNGLPMGGCISPTIARLVMDRVISHLYDTVPTLTFIRVFVDDTIVSIDPAFTDMALDAINNFHNKMKFTMEREDENLSINFLNLNLMRVGNKITTNWYRKGFASGRLVNFYSSHKRSTITGTAEAFIRTILLLSDPIHFNSNKSKVILTLRENCFPDTTIERLMNKFYTLMKPVTNTKNKRTLRGKIIYKVFPHALLNYNKIKKIITKRILPGIVLADSTKNTKINFITTRKTKIPYGKRSNLIVMSKCICGRKHKIHTTGFNQTGEMVRDFFLTKYKKCTGELHAFRKVKYQRGLAYGSQTKYLLKYIKHFYRGKLINITADLPNYHLIRALKKINMPDKIRL